MSPERARILEELASAVAAVDVGHPLRVAVDGVDGAGKTTLADELAPLVAARGRPCVRASVDDFHRPRDDRYRHRELSPEGFYEDTFDYDSVRKLLLMPLGPGGDRRVRVRTWDHAGDAPAAKEWLTVRDDAVLLCDGVFLARDGLRGLWDATVFVAAEIEVAAERGIVRDARWTTSLDATRERYRVRYTPAQRRYLSERRPDEQADFVLENTDPQAPRLLVRHP